LTLPIWIVSALTGVFMRQAYSRVTQGSARCVATRNEVMRKLLVSIRNPSLNYFLLGMPLPLARHALRE
jgi:hypothetical protein